MAVSSVVIISLSVLIASWISGLFGMAGGLVLMFVLLQYLSLGGAIITHSFLQLFSGGFRAAMNFKFIHKKIFLYYMLGDFLAMLAMFFVDIEISKKLVMMSIGGASILMPLFRQAPVDIRQPKTIFSMGLLIGGLQFGTGWAGPLFNIMFLNPHLKKDEVVATKSAICVFSHILKIIYFFPLFLQQSLPTDLLYAIPLLVIYSFVGTQWSQVSRAKLGEKSFLVAGRYIVSFMGIVCLFKGLSI